MGALNEVFSTDFTDSDRLLVSQITENMLSDNDLMNKVRNNPKENVAAIFNKFFDKQLVNFFNSNESFYNKINNNEQLNDRLKRDLLDLLYEELGKQ